MIHTLRFRASLGLVFAVLAGCYGTRSVEHATATAEHAFAYGESAADRLAAACTDEYGRAMSPQAVAALDQFCPAAAAAYDDLRRAQQDLVVAAGCRRARPDELVRLESAVADRLLRLERVLRQAESARQ